MKKWILPVLIFISMPSVAHAKNADSNPIPGIIVIIVICVALYLWINRRSGKVGDSETKIIQPAPTQEDEEQIKKHYAEKILQKAAELDPLPTIRTLLPLNRGESCHLSLNCEAHEIKEVTTSVKYSVSQVRLGRGMATWRIGQAFFDRQKEIKSMPIGRGTVFMTNKRIIFEGGVKNVVVPFSQILNVKYEIRQNVFYIERLRGGIISLSMNSEDILDCTP